jgi:glutaconate CoA-transferase subunit A
MVDLLSLEAAAALVPDGCTLALGGMTLYRRPVAFARALIARPAPPRDLTLLAFTAGYESDLLVGAGCVARVRSCYFGLGEFGFAPMFTAKAGRGELAIIEETETSLALGLRAAISGVGFLPSRAWAGTDLFALRPDVRTVIDPYSGETLTAFPAIHVDVAVLHALEADADGNALLNNNLGIDLELVYAARTVIITAERLVARVARSLDGVVVPAPGANVIVEAPRGAWPTSCYPLYPIGGGELLRHVESGGAA